MSYSHTLNIENHSHIIGRQDGVTGDSIKANDKVIFCTVCQSVFLKESWEYMNSIHCVQSETLDFIPAPVPKLIAKKKEVKLIFETFSTYRQRLAIVLLIGFFIPILLFYIPFLFYLINFLPQNFYKENLLLISAVFGFVGIMQFVFVVWNNKLFKKIIGINKKTLRILENGLEIKKEKIYSFYEMQKIHYSKTKKENKLVIYLKNGEIVNYSFPKDEYQKTKDFLFGLVWIAQFVQTTIYVESQKEYGLAKSIERNYVAKFLVLEDSMY